MIEIHNLGKYYGEQKVLSNISLEVRKGDVFGIVGHSGAGKSTLLRCMKITASALWNWDTKPSAVSNMAGSPITTSHMRRQRNMG